MKALIGVALLALSLAGCASTGATLPGTEKVVSGVQTTRDTITKVQNYTKQVCGFLPTAASVAAIFNVSIAGSISAIGGAICDAVTTNPLAEGDKPGYYKAQTVHGVKVEGRFVKAKPKRRSR